MSITLCDEWLAEQKAAGKECHNPMVVTFGFGPKDKRCKHCAHLCYHEVAKRYYKCRLRGITCGAATDHRCNWPTCGKFQEEVDA
jgi:hypothetical protein